MVLSLFHVFCPVWRTCDHQLGRVKRRKPRGAEARPDVTAAGISRELLGHLCDIVFSPPAGGLSIRRVPEGHVQPRQQNHALSGKCVHQRIKRPPAASETDVAVGENVRGLFFAIFIDYILLSIRLAVTPHIS